MNPHYELITDSLGNKRVGAFVTVKDYPSGAVSTIYTTDGLTVQSNPLTSDGDGYVKFSVPDGKYSFSVSYAGVASTTPPITIGGPEAAGGNSVLAALAASTGLALSGTSSGNNAQVEMNLKPTKVASVAALNAATTASLPSGFIYLQSYNAGQNQGGGMLVKLAAPVTPDNVLTFNDASGASYQRVDAREITIQMCGGVADGATDIYLSVTRAAAAGVGKLHFPYEAQSYKCNTACDIGAMAIEIAPGAVIDGRGAFSGSYIFRSRGSLVALPTLSVTPVIGATSITFSTPPDLVVGDSFCLFDSATLWNAARSYYYAGENCEVADISGSCSDVKNPTLRLI